MHKPPAECHWFRMTTLYPRTQALEAGTPDLNGVPGEWNREEGPPMWNRFWSDERGTGTGQAVSAALVLTLLGLVIGKVLPGL